jgi:hypothetical protein
MSVSTQDYALLSAHVYGDMPDKPLVVGEEFDNGLGGARYKVLEVSDKFLHGGYQGAIYQNRDTGELVVAHRGTEFVLGKEGVTDLLIADGGMVLAAMNQQVGPAMKLMQRAEELSNDPKYFSKNGQPPPISVTGHSLGGFLAEYTSYRTGATGESFNAYGAAGLYGVPEGKGSHGMINHMRASDFVSAGNGHYGEVRVYANRDDITALNKGAQQGTGGFLYDVGSNVNAHRMGASFTPPDHFVISEENRQRYRDNKPAIDAFRDDVRSTRENITFASQSALAMRGDVSAMHYVVSHGIPKVPDHVQRSAIDVALKPHEALLDKTGDGVKVAANAHGAMVQNTATFAGKAAGACVELYGTAVNKAHDVAGDASQKVYSAAGVVQQQITTQTGRLHAGVLEASGDVKAAAVSTWGGLGAFKDRMSAEMAGAALSAASRFNAVGGLVSEDMKTRAESLDKTAAAVRQYGRDTAHTTLSEAAVDAKQIRQSAQQNAHVIQQGANALGQVQREALQRNGVEANKAWDAAGTSVQKNSEQAAHTLRKTTAEFGDSRRGTIQGAGVAVDTGLDKASAELKALRQAAQQHVTNPRPAEGTSLENAAHPKHALFFGAREFLEKLGDKTGLKTPQEVTNVAGALTAKASKELMDKFHQVFANKDATRIVAVQGDIKDPAHKRVEVSTAQARQQSIEQSTQQANQSDAAVKEQAPLQAVKQKAM